MGKNVKKQENTGFYVVQTSLAKVLCGIVILQDDFDGFMFRPCPTWNLKKKGL